MTRPPRVPNGVKLRPGDRVTWIAGANGTAGTGEVVLVRGALVKVLWPTTSRWVVRDQLEKP